MTNFFSSLPSEDRGTERMLNRALTHVSWLKCLSISDYFVCFVGPVLLQLIQQLGSKHWCAVPLLFVSQALSKLSPGPLLGVDGLTALRWCNIMLTFKQMIVVSNA